MLPFLLNMEGHRSPTILADAITMEEFKTEHRPKVVLSWAPHQSFASSCCQFFVEMMQLQEADFVITHPEGYELNRNY
jgi:N-succinyl-L-ornithine transcarbamylase